VLVTEPALIAPTVRLHSSWLDSWAEWGLDAVQQGASVASATRLGLDLTNPHDFARWVEDLLLQADPTRERPADRVPATNQWVAESDTYLGAIQLRHGLTPVLLELGGHIGFGIRPSARRRGLASLALGGTLPRARRLGLDRVLITCDDDNPGSYRTIERHGGRLENTRQPDDFMRSVGFVKPLRRYWISL